MAAGGNNLSACNRVNIPNGGGGSGSPSLGTNSSSPSSLSGGVGPGGAGAGAGAGVGGGGGSAAAVVIYREPMYNWQATKTTVKERFAFLFNNEILSDVHFLVGKGMGTQRIPAHRFVLAVGSAVFDAMFNGGMATTSTEIELPDVEPAAFLALLKFLYSDEVQIGPETVMTTLYTAKKYAVPALEAHCVEFLKKNLRADNAFMLLTQVRWNIHVVHDICLQKELRRMARLFDEPQLASLCLENIDKNTSDAINAEGFTDIDLDTLMAVLERDTLGIREIRLFNAVVRWAEAECQRQQLQLTPENKRKVLGKALSLIRFPLMTIEEFAAGPAQSGILTDREVVSLFLHFTVNPKPRVEFIDRPRCCLRGKECSINRFQQVESRWGYSGTSDRIRFTVNRRIFVVGFGLYGSIHGPTDYQVNIQIIHTDSNTILGQNDTGFSCDGSSNTFRVMFKEPVEILPNVNYTACATLKGPDSHYGTKGLRKVIHESPTTGTKTVFTFCYAAGNNNGTSVEDGQVPEIIFYT
ncbi:BTB/POZ domain-containing protein 2-like isoform X3 [Chiloscyllium plagiosum]|uniref:BTB/POZ domain-containing protein 2-like isoform X3 n=1 Tax=Chiloscyllium plagiosum TaxID=36176 RepID=UPI001CB80A58|nr:BTB/POZ domain-containing protein 2-like isoform X3 [Chiloscyllium plagiosum]